MRVEDWAVAGVPIYVRTGKRLPARVTEWPSPSGGALLRSTTARAVTSGAEHPHSPDPARRRGDQAWSRGQGTGEKFHLRSVAMDFSYEEAFAGADAADGYERLIHDAMVGDATLFIRSDEVEQAWRIVDSLPRGLVRTGGALHFYAGRHGATHGGPAGRTAGDEWRARWADSS